MSTQQNRNNPGSPGLGPGKRPSQSPKSMRGLMWVLYAIFGFAMIWIVRSYSGSDPVKTEWLTVKESMIPDGDVERITYVTNEYRAEVYIKKDSLPKYVNKYFGGRTPAAGPHFYFIVSSNFNAEESFEEARMQLSRPRSATTTSARYSTGSSSPCCSSDCCGSSCSVPCRRTWAEAREAASSTSASPRPSSMRRRTMSR